MPDFDLKIITGGQTGVDRGALDAALALGIPCGGWCPEGRVDENGRIPEHYPLKELRGAGFLERTIKNVEESDATLVIYFADLQGGTKSTVEACLAFTKPNLLLDGARDNSEESANLALQFVREHRVHVLNVAGPRASEEARGYAYAFNVITYLLQRLSS